MAKGEKQLMFVLRRDICGIHTKDLLHAEINRLSEVVEAMEEICANPVQAFNMSFFRRHWRLLTGYQRLLRLRHHAVADETILSRPELDSVHARLCRQGIEAPLYRTSNHEVCKYARTEFMRKVNIFLVAIRNEFPAYESSWDIITGKLFESGYDSSATDCPTRKGKVESLESHARELYNDPTRRSSYLGLAQIADDDIFDRFKLYILCFIAKNHTDISRQEVLHSMQEDFMVTGLTNEMGILRHFLSCHLSLLLGTKPSFESGFERLKEELDNVFKQHGHNFGQIGVSMAIMLCAATLRYGLEEDSKSGLVNEFVRHLTQDPKIMSQRTLSLDKSERGFKLTISTIHGILEHHLNPNVLPFMVIMMDFLNLLSRAGGAVVIAETLQLGKLAYFLNNWVLETQIDLSKDPVPRLAFTEHHQIRGTVCDQYREGFYANHNPLIRLEPVYVEPSSERASYIIQSAMMLCAVEVGKSYTWLGLDSTRFYVRHVEMQID